MVQTSTPITGCDAGIWLDNLGGTQKDIGGSTNQYSLNFDMELGMLRTFGSRWPKRIECGKDASFGLQIVYSTAADEGFDILKKWYFATSPGSRSIKFYLPDKNVGSDVFSAEVKIDSFNWTVSAGSAEPVIVTLNLLPDGEVTHASNAT